MAAFKPPTSLHPRTSFASTSALETILAATRRTLSSQGLLLISSFDGVFDSPAWFGVDWIGLSLFPVQTSLSSFPVLLIELSLLPSLSSLFTLQISLSSLCSSTQTLLIHSSELHSASPCTYTCTNSSYLLITSRISAPHKLLCYSIKLSSPLPIQPHSHSDGSPPPPLWPI